MRDPLRNVSVRYKLALTFVGVCLLAFGVGGYLVSRSAVDSLEREITLRLRVQSETFATALGERLRALGQRAHDFASDGFIRSGFEAISSGDDSATESRLREHLLKNKLPIVPAFVNLAVAAPSGTEIFLAKPDDDHWTRELPSEAFGEQDWYSPLLPPPVSEAPPTIVLATPLRSLVGGERIGTLLVKVHPGQWIAGALPPVRAGEEAEAAPALRLIDSAGRTLRVPPDSSSFATTDPASDPRGGRDDWRPGLTLGGPVTAEPVVQKRGTFARRHPLGIGGWSVETTLQSRKALESVSGLQARFWIVGIALTAAACAFLLFPMRFLARPLRELRDAARRVTEGDFGARVEVDSTDEIGELARSFNSMAAAVEERTRELETAAHTLETRKDELRTERDRLSAVIRSMRDGLIVTDADGKPDVWNSAARPLLDLVERNGEGLTAHRLCQESAGHAGEAHSDQPAGENRCVRCLFEPTAPPRSCLIDAGPNVYEVRSTRLSSTAEGRSGRVLVARDVTDRVAQDEREMHQERISVLGEVAAVVAHELNNPLAAIKMFAQMIASKLPADSPLLEDVNVIERNTQACSQTIRELLDYATGAAPEVGRVDVHETLDDVARFLRALRERKEVELVLQLEADSALVVGDEVQLRQVFVNLIMNAIQAIDSSGGRVSVRTSLEPGHLVVDVGDDGPGVPADVEEAIFRPFYTTKPRGAGTGLGLSTARRITEIQGGSLDLLDGRAGHTTFRVRLLRSDA